MSTTGRLTVALETATDRCSVAVVEGVAAGDEPRLVAEAGADGARSHTRVLLALLDDALRRAGAASPDIGGLIVGTGPGTFTGVRIGVATARGLALALGIPVVGRSSLSALLVDALERGFVPEGRRVALTAIDARRGQVFALPYRLDPERRGWIPAGPVSAEDPDGLRERVRYELGEEPFVVGDERIADLPARPEARGLVLGWERLLDADGLDLAARAVPASGALPVGAPGSPEAVAPEYVRSPDADRHIQKMRDPWAG